MDYTNTEWPWAVDAANGAGCATAAIVHGCAVGLTVRTKSTERALPLKQWKFEVSNGPVLLSALRAFQCSGGHKHAAIEGAVSKQTESYPALLAGHLADEART